MKHFIKTIILLTLISNNLFSQIHTVDNFNPGADFTDLQMAIDSSDDGDTIYVAGSNTTYGNIIVNKSLVIFGNGYETTATSTKSQIGNLNFQNGCHLSHISGFEMNYANLSNSYTTDIDSLTLSDNKADYVIIQRGGYHLIEGNLLERSSNWALQLGANSSSGCNNTTVKNNILYSPILYSIANTNLIENNVFFRFVENYTADPFYFNSKNKNATVINNIFFGSSEAVTQGDCQNCTFLFNRYYHHDGTDYVGDNPLFIAPDTLATNNVHTYSEDHDINLQAGSPAIGAGQNGFDQGATGGATPFEYGGFAPIPRITSFTSTETTVEAGGTLQVIIQAVSKQ